VFKRIGERFPRMMLSKTFRVVVTVVAAIRITLAINRGQCAVLKR
jgi:hypothetical protein